MQGIYIAGQRPKSKAEIGRELSGCVLGRVSLEATSLFGNEYNGPVVDAPDGRYPFVGPDPHTDRRFYGTLTIRGGVAKVA